MTAWASDRYTKSVQFLGIKFTYSYRSSNSFMGRFGGGWNWKLGVQVGGKSTIISLLVAEIRIEKVREKSL